MLKFGHVGISVRNLEKSVDFYVSALGLKLVFGPTRQVNANEGWTGTLCARKMGSDFKSLRLAILQIDEGHGIELFEFPDASTKEPFAYGTYLKQPGQFLFSICDTDLAVTCEKIKSAGGFQQSEILQLWESKDWKIVYCSDPDGNVFELTSHSFQKMWLPDTNKV